MVSKGGKYANGFVAVMVVFLLAFALVASAWVPSATAQSGVHGDKKLPPVKFEELPEGFREYVEWMKARLEEARRGGNYVPGERLVRVQIPSTDTSVAARVANELRNAVGASSASVVTVYQESAGNAARNVALIKLVFASEDEARSKEQALNSMRNRGVLGVAKNLFVSAPKPLNVKEFSGPVQPMSSSDPLRGWQWHLDKIKDVVATPPPAPTPTDPAVAVIDTGVDYTHEDLSGRVILGYDYVNNDPDPMDDNGHGTHVAGIIAAKRDNGKGVAGVAPNWRIYAVKVLSASGWGTWGNIVAGIIEAANRPEVKIINLSLGGYVRYGSAEWDTICNAVAYASVKGKIVVAAAGNEANLELYALDHEDGFLRNFEWREVPAGCPGVVGVAATDESDERAFFSNYGILNLIDFVDVAAPGWNILSTYLGNDYAILSGTSMAAPIVAGVLARVWSSMGLSAGPFSVLSRVLTTGKQLGPAKGFVLPTPRVDLARALSPTMVFRGIQGYVWSALTGTPISGATVQITGPVTVMTTTNGWGFFTVSGIPPGTYQVTASAPGHIPLTQTVVVPSGGFADDVRFFLAVDPGDPDVVTVVVEWSAIHPGLDSWLAWLGWFGNLEHPDLINAEYSTGMAIKSLIRILPDNALVMEGITTGDLTSYPYAEILVNDVSVFKPFQSLAFRRMSGRTVEVAAMSSPHLLGLAQYGRVTTASVKARVYVGSSLAAVISGPGSGISDFWWQIVRVVDTGAPTTLNKRDPFTNFLVSWPAPIITRPPYDPVPGSQVLLVDDDGSSPLFLFLDDYSGVYEGDLSSLSVTYSYWNTFWLGPPSASYLAGYKAVIWFTGDDFLWTFSQYERNAFTTFISSTGKRALVTGQDIGFDMFVVYSTPDQRNFYRNVLRARWIADDASSFVGTPVYVIGIPSNPLSNGIASEVDQPWPDVIAPAPSSGAQPLFYYVDNPSTPSVPLVYVAGIYWSTGTSTSARKLIYLGFGYEAMTDGAMRTLFLQRAVNWLLA